MGAYVLKKWPDRVYPGEIDSAWNADAKIDVFLNEMKKYGPAPEGYATKHHNKSKRYIWQSNLKVDGRQIRILYAQYNKVIVLLHIHKKSSPQEQERGYAVAISRKKEADAMMSGAGKGQNGLYALN